MQIITESLLWNVPSARQQQPYVKVAGNIGLPKNLYKKRQSSGNTHDDYVRMKRSTAPQGRINNRKEQEREQARLDQYEYGLVYNGNMGHLEESRMLIKED